MNKIWILSNILVSSKANEGDDYIKIKPFSDDLSIITAVYK